MALQLDHKKKEVTIIGEIDMDDLAREIQGRESWKIFTENGLQLIIQKKKKYVYPFGKLEYPTF